MAFSAETPSCKGNTDASSLDREKEKKRWPVVLGAAPGESRSLWHEEVLRKKKGTLSWLEGGKREKVGA